MQTIDDIVEGCKNGDRQAQKELFDRFAPKMMSVCMRYCKEENDAKDVLQDGFVKVFTKIESFKGDSRVDTWMSRIFVHTALNFIQRVKKANLFVEFDSNMEIAEEETVEKESHDVRKVRAAIDALPDIYSSVLNMYAIDGMGHKEISGLLGITEGSSKSRLSRARQLLKKEIEKN